MEELEQNMTPDVPRPRTWKVLGLLTLVATAFSWLGSYAVANALVGAEVIRPWQPESDPRPKWFLLGFCLLMLGFILLGGFFRFMSQRQLKEIDAMTEEEAVA